MAVLQNAPSLIHLDKNRDALLAKRNRFLTRLYEKGEISDDDYELSIEEPLTRSTTARLFVLSMASMWLEKACNCDVKAGNFDAIEKIGG